MPPVPRPKTSKRGGWNNRGLVVALVLAVVLGVPLIVGSIVLAGRGGDDSSSGTVGAGAMLVEGIPQDGTTLGDPAAPVAFLVYEDIQCPFCKQYSDAAFPAIVDEYVRTGKVRVDFRGLDFLGQDSTQALRAILAAAEQDRAWQLIGLLYDNQGEEGSGWVTDVLVRDLASSIAGLDVDRMLADANSDEITAEIDKVATEAEQREVGGTPWFFVAAGDGAPYNVRPRPLDDPAAFRQIFDDALAG